MRSGRSGRAIYSRAREECEHGHGDAYVGELARRGHVEGRGVLSRGFMEEQERSGVLEKAWEGRRQPDNGGGRGAGHGHARRRPNGGEIGQRRGKARARSRGSYQT